MIVKSSFVAEGPFTESAFVLHAVMFKIWTQSHVDIISGGQKAQAVGGMEGLSPNYPQQEKAI